MEFRLRKNFTPANLMKTYGWATCSHSVEFLLCDKNGKVGQKRLILLGLQYLENFQELADGFTKHMHSRHGWCMFLIMKRQAACSSVVSNNGFPSLGPSFLLGMLLITVASGYDDAILSVPARNF